METGRGNEEITPIHNGGGALPSPNNLETSATFEGTNADSLPQNQTTSQDTRPIEEDIDKAIIDIQAKDLELERKALVAKQIINKASESLSKRTDVKQGKNITSGVIVDVDDAGLDKDIIEAMKGFAKNNSGIAIGRKEGQVMIIRNNTEGLKKAQENGFEILDKSSESGNLKQSTLNILKNIPLNIARTSMLYRAMESRMERLSQYGSFDKRSKEGILHKARVGLGFIGARDLNKGVYVKTSSASTELEGIGKLKIDRIVNLYKDDLPVDQERDEFFQEIGITQGGIKFLKHQKNLLEQVGILGAGTFDGVRVLGGILGGASAPAILAISRMAVPAEAVIKAINGYNNYLIEKNHVIKASLLGASGLLTGFACASWSEILANNNLSLPVIEKLMNSLTPEQKKSFFNMTLRLIATGVTGAAVAIQTRKEGGPQHSQISRLYMNAFSGGLATQALISRLWPDSQKIFNEFNDQIFGVQGSDSHVRVVPNSVNLIQNNNTNVREMGVPIGGGGIAGMTAEEFREATTNATNNLERARDILIAEGRTADALRVTEQLNLLSTGNFANPQFINILQGAQHEFDLAAAIPNVDHVIPAVNPAAGPFPPGVSFTMVPLDGARPGVWVEHRFQELIDREIAANGNYDRNIYGYLNAIRQAPIAVREQMFRDYVYNRHLMNASMASRILGIDNPETPIMEVDTPDTINSAVEFFRNGGSGGEGTLRLVTEDWAIRNAEPVNPFSANPLGIENFRRMQATEFIKVPLADQPPIPGVLPPLPFGVPVVGPTGFIMTPFGPINERIVAAIGIVAAAALGLIAWRNVRRARSAQRDLQQAQQQLGRANQALAQQRAQQPQNPGGQTPQPIQQQQPQQQNNQGGGNTQLPGPIGVQGGIHYHINNNSGQIIIHQPIINGNGNTVGDINASGNTFGVPIGGFIPTPSPAQQPTIPTVNIGGQSPQQQNLTTSGNTPPTAQQPANTGTNPIEQTFQPRTPLFFQEDDSTGDTTQGSQVLSSGATPGQVGDEDIPTPTTNMIDNMRKEAIKTSLEGNENLDLTEVLNDINSIEDPRQNYIFIRLITESGSGMNREAYEQYLTQARNGELTDGIFNVSNVSNASSASQPIQITTGDDLNDIYNYLSSSYDTINAFNLYQQIASLPSNQIALINLAIKEQSQDLETISRMVRDMKNTYLTGNSDLSDSSPIIPFDQLTPPDGEPTQELATNLSLADSVGPTQPKIRTASSSLSVPTERNISSEQQYFDSLGLGEVEEVTSNPGSGSRYITPQETDVIRNLESEINQLSVNDYQNITPAVINKLNEQQLIKSEVDLILQEVDNMQPVARTMILEFIKERENLNLDDLSNFIKQVPNSAN